MITDNNKVICTCINVTVQDIKDVIKKGAVTFEEVQTITKVGTGCGKCEVEVKTLINELLEEQV